MFTRRSPTRALLCATVVAFAALPAPASAQRIDEIVAFGDSYADDGNLFEILGFNPAPLVYPTGRFSGGTNYIDTLAMLLDADVDNFAIGGALTGNTNTNAPELPGFATEWNAFLAGGGGPFPTVEGTFDEDDLLAISIGGNDARFYQVTGGTLEGAPAAAQVSVAQAAAGLDALVGAGAQNISFLAGNTAVLPEIAGDPAAQDVRNAFSASFNSGMQQVLAGYAADGAMVHYLDLTLVGERIMADPEAYGLASAGACAPAAACVGDSAYANRFLFYVDQLHLTSAGFAIVAQYVATQLQAPLTLQAPSDLGLDTARQFGRTLTSRVDLAAPRDGDLAEGMRVFAVGDTFSRDVEQDRATDAFDIDGVGITAGVTYGLGTSIVGLAANYSRPRARFGAAVSETETESWQIGGFAGYTLGPVFAQGYAGYGRDSHEIERAGVVDSMTATPDGDHWLAGLKAGYLMPVGIMRAGPVAALDYARADVDGYTESGDSALTLNVESVSARSMTAGIGAELRGDFGGGGIQLRPFASAMIEADLLGDGRTVRFAQTSAPGIVNSWKLEDRSKDPYGRFAVGGSAEILTGASLDALMSTTVGKQEGDEVSAHVGLRLGL